MIREADQWAIASSDTRAVANGKNYLAQVLGVWNDFSEGRPGLVSFWSDQSHLTLYVREHAQAMKARLLLVRLVGSR